MNIRKDKLPRGKSYPLKSSALERALEEAGLSVDVVLNFSPSSRYFEAFFWPPNEDVDYDRFYIRTGAVDRADGGHARTRMETHVVPKFIEWATARLALPTNSPIRREKGYFGVDYTDCQSS